jgi:hypothetical protein
VNLSRNLFHAGAQIVTLSECQRSNANEKDAQYEFGDQRLGEFKNDQQEKY